MYLSVDEDRKKSFWLMKDDIFKPNKVIACLLISDWSFDQQIRKQVMSWDQMTKC